MNTSANQLILHGVLMALGLVCAVAMWRVLAGLGVHVPLDPNEGWNAYHTAAAMHGRALYPPPDAYLVNNYPPLSYYVVGIAGWFTGDYIVAGRIVSLLAFLAIAVEMYFAARWMGARVPALAPLIFTSALLLFTDYVGMDDPQMLAHAVSLGGLLVLLRGLKDWKGLAAAAALFVGAFFVKHNVVALPAAAALWLAWHDRRAATKFAVCGAGLLILGLLTFRLVYGVSLLSVVSTARTYSFAVMQTNLLGWLHWTGVLFITLGGLLTFRGRDPYVRFCALYAGVATAVGAVFLGGGGVDWNVLFEADMALAFSAALAVSTLKDWRRPAAAFLVAAPLLYSALANREWQELNLQRHPFTDEAAVAGNDIAFMAARRGPAVCEMLSFCYWAGKPPAVDVFNVGQQFETGARSDAELVRGIDAKKFAVIQFDPDSPYSLGENVHNAMDRSYRVQHSDDFGTFYVPK